MGHLDPTFSCLHFELQLAGSGLVKRILAWVRVRKTYSRFFHRPNDFGKPEFLIINQKVEH